MASEAFLHQAWELWEVDGPEDQLEDNPVAFVVAEGSADSSSVALRAEPVALVAVSIPVFELPLAFQQAWHFAPYLWMTENEPAFQPFRE